MPQPAIIWDFFGVICSEVAPFWFADHFPSDEAKDLKREVVGAADRGEITEAQLFEELGRRVGSTAHAVRHAWRDLAIIDADVVRLVSESRQLGKVGLLTNCPSPFVRDLLSANRLDHLFDAIVVSSEVKVAKPHRRAYELMLAALNVDPSAAMMIDDNPDNVAGALEAGLKGIQFTTASECRVALGI